MPPEAIISVLFGVLGAFCGSFAGVLAERLNTGGSWVRGRSRCNTCDRALGSRDLIPVLSFVFSNGRCLSCATRIPVRYVITELAFALVFALGYLHLGFSLLLPLFLLISTVLGALVLYDLRHTIVPESLSRILVVLGLVYALVTAENSAVLGISFFTAGCIGLGFFLLHFFSRGRAMGLGDAPVALALSLIAGKGAIAGLLFSFWIGAIVGIGILVLRPPGTRMGIEVPFVPFLALGFFLAYFTGWNPLDIVIQ